MKTHWNYILMKIIRGHTEEKVKVRQKLFKSIAVMIMIIFSLTGCGNKPVIENEDNHLIINETDNNSSVTVVEVLNSDNAISNKEIDEEDVSFGVDYFDRGHISIGLEKEFYVLVADNPIDNDLIFEEFDTGNTYLLIEYFVECRNAWEAEINSSLEILKNYLSNEDFEFLTSSHKSWKQYMENRTSVEVNLFYPGSEYDTGDSMIQPFVMAAAAARTREYAIELKSLEFALTGTVEFIF